MGEAAEDDAEFRERLRTGWRSWPAPGKNKAGLVDNLAEQMAGRLWDEHSKGRFCGMLWDVTKGVTMPHEVIKAFDGALGRLVDGTVGVAGSYFFGTFDYMRSDRAHDEVEAEAMGGLTQ